MKPANWLFEEGLWNTGYSLVCGLDEVGRGAWAGPVVSAAVIFPAKVNFPRDLFDSKLIDAPKRQQLAQIIRETASYIGVGLIGVKDINKRGIGIASQMSFRWALKELMIKPDFLLVDAFYVNHISKKKQLPIVKGDSISASIAAASIIAKVFRDDLMTQLHKMQPDYRFDKHKGYGTKFHQEMIRKFGFSSHHRRSFDLDWLLTPGYDIDTRVSRTDPFTR